MTRIAAWVSCGNNSAVAAKITLDEHPNDEIALARCIVLNEHEDNDRFAADLERWFGRSITRLASTEYIDCWDVWERRHFISGPHGAPCTINLKKAVRWDFERSWRPDFQVFGFSFDEQKRADRFREQNPDVRMLCPLIDHRLTKADCAAIIAGTGIEGAMMYRLGFGNNNCKCCGKATSIIYWARCRHFFPVEFQRMVRLSRRLGARLTRLKGKRIFLDEIPLDIDWRKKDPETVECGVLCTKVA